MFTSSIPVPIQQPRACAQAAHSRPWFKRPISLLLVVGIAVALQAMATIVDALIH